MGDVPVTANFQDVYPDDAQQGQRQRWNSLLKSFDAEYGLKAEFIARSPGRVNIIGEVTFGTPCSTLALRSCFQVAH